MAVKTNPRSLRKRVNLSFNNTFYAQKNYGKMLNEALFSNLFNLFFFKKANCFSMKRKTKRRRKGNKKRIKSSFLLTKTWFIRSFRSSKTIPIMYKYNLKRAQRKYNLISIPRSYTAKKSRSKRFSQLKTKNYKKRRFNLKK